MKRPPAKNFQDLVVWQKAHQLLAKDLDYGDTSQQMAQLEEVSKLLEGYASAILDTDS